MPLLFRFLAGGALVSLFAVLGDSFKPKSFAGIFGAAPSVALAGLALACAERGAPYAREEARAMIVGAGALLAYGVACHALLRRTSIPPWAGAGTLWAAWLAVAAAGYFGALR